MRPGVRPGVRPYGVASSRNQPYVNVGVAGLVPGNREAVALEPLYVQVRGSTGGDIKVVYIQFVPRVGIGPTREAESKESRFGVGVRENNLHTLPGVVLRAREAAQRDEGGHIVGVAQGAYLYILVGGVAVV